MDVARRIDPGLKLIIGGSYRRGKADSGDIDILITHKRRARLQGVLRKIVNELHRLEFLTDDLSSTMDDNSTIYNGVCCLPGRLSALHRRIDLKVFPRDEFGVALLYFTGSENFNRSMRLWAKKRGYHLGNHELVKLLGGEKGERVPVQSEADVFRVLGLQYRAPAQRNV